MMTVVTQLQKASHISKQSQNWTTNPEIEITNLSAALKQEKMGEKNEVA